MEKIAVGPAAIDAIDIERTPAENVAAVAGALW
jgi:fructose-1,6-bisphosphatase/sedoheptulose 1,7-bisphosphatase-like protein